MELTIKLGAKDWASFQSYLESELPRQMEKPAFSFARDVLMWALIVATGLVLFDMAYEFHWPSALFVTVIFILISIKFVHEMNRIKKAFAPAEHGSFVGTHHFRFSAKGIESEGAEYHGLHTWKGVKKIQHAKGMIMIFLDTAFAFVFPEDRLDDADSFFGYIHECHQNS